VCRVVPIARVAAHIVVGAPPRRTVRDERRRDKGLVDGTSIVSTPPLRAGPPRYRNRPRLGSTTDHRSPSATVAFMRLGLRLIGHAQEDLPYTGECEFAVMVREDGFSFPGCWGSDKPMTYDPDDREYPFKGRSDGMLFWLAPS